MTSPRTILWFVILCIAAAGALAALEYDRLARSYYAGMTLSEARSTRDRLNLLLFAPLATQHLTATFLSRANAGHMDQTAAKSLLSLALAQDQDQDQALDAAAIVDAGHLLAFAARGRNQAGPGPEPSSGEAGNAGAAPGAPAGAASPAQDKDIEAFGRMLTRATAACEGNWPCWTGIHGVPGSAQSAITTLVPASREVSDSPLLAFSFNLRAIGDALWRDVPEGAQVLVIDAQGRLLDQSRMFDPPPPPGSSTPLFVSPEQTNDDVLANAVAAWREAEGRASEAFVFRAQGKTWQACVSSLIEGQQGTFVGLAIPLESLTEALSKGRRTPTVLAGAWLLSLVLLVVLATRLRPRVLPVAPDPLEGGDRLRDLLAKGESDRLEFKSTLRFNLGAGRPGKEIELASLKALAAFMNSDGGKLVVGVDDQGQAIGLEADRFENDDHLLRHFTTIYVQHIGVEFFKYVSFAVRSLDGKKLLLVACEKSNEPVILKTGKEEEFYVRAGPSNRRLTLSEFMRRIAQPTPRGRG